MLGPRGQVDVCLVEQEHRLEPRLWRLRTPPRHGHKQLRDPEIHLGGVAQKSGADHREPHPARPGMRAGAEQGVHIQSLAAGQQLPVIQFQREKALGEFGVKPGGIAAADGVQERVVLLFDHVPQ